MNNVGNEIGNEIRPAEVQFEVISLTMDYDDIISHSRYLGSFGLHLNIPGRIRIGNDFRWTLRDKCGGLER